MYKTKYGDMLFKPEKHYRTTTVLMALRRKKDFVNAWHSGTRYFVSDTVLRMEEKKLVTVDRQLWNDIEIYRVMITWEGREFLNNKLNVTYSTLLAILALAVGIAALFLPHGQ